MPEFSSTLKLMEALCRGEDPDLFFPNATNEKIKRKAKTVCSRCNSTPACLQYALDNNLPGIWGGTDEDERDTLRLKRAGNINERVGAK